MGVDIDLRTNMASIPEPKVKKIRAYLDVVVTKKRQARIELRFLEEMLGLLNWISSLLVSGRFHMAQIVSARISFRSLAWRTPWCVLVRLGI